MPATRRDVLRGIGAAGAAAAGAFTLGASGHAEPGNSLVAHFRRMRSTLADNDNLFGAHRVIPVARDQLERIGSFIPGARGDVLRDLFHTQAEFADLLSWLYEDSGDFSTAQIWTGRALDYAHMSGRSASVGFVLARRSQLAGDMGDVNAATLSAEAALSMLGDNKRISAIAATQLAHAYALSGDASESDEAFERARILLSEHEGDDEVWGAFFDANYIDVFNAHSRAALGDYRTAAVTYKAAVENVPETYRRDQGVYLAHQARTVVQSGDEDEGLSLAMAALTVNSETKSVRGLRELRTLQGLVKASDSSAARSFRELASQTALEV